MHRHSMQNLFQVEQPPAELHGPSASAGTWLGVRPEACSVDLLRDKPGNGCKTRLCKSAQHSVANAGQANSRLRWVVKVGQSEPWIHPSKSPILARSTRSATNPEDHRAREATAASLARCPLHVLAPCAERRARPRTSETGGKPTFAVTASPK